MWWIDTSAAPPRIAGKARHRSGHHPHQLRPGNIEIPGHTENDRLPADTWGINLGAAKDNFPHDGLQLFIKPWSNVGDSVASCWMALVTQRAIGSTAEVGQRVTLFIKPERLTNGAHEIKYRVTRLGGSPEDSVAQAIHIKLERPGRTRTAMFRDTRN
jgi:hypothetical protein